MKASITLIGLSAILACLTLLAQESPRPAAGGGLAERFKQLDKNGDGQLNKEEFKKPTTLGQGKFKDRPEVFDRLFVWLDVDKDGALSLHEYKKIVDLRGSSGPLSSPTPAPTPGKTDAGKPTATTAPAPAQKDAAYKREPGPFKVQTVMDLVLRDEKRQKDLPLRISHPDGMGPFPVIVFSHGARASKDDYLPLTEHWAGHGYVTIQPDHSDSRALGVKVGDTIVLRDWQNRPADVSFILDSLDELERKEPALKGKMNRERIGVGGHSFGANTAQLIGGAKAVVLGGEKSFADKRVTAVVLLSGQGSGEMLTEESWMKLTRPMLVMTGSRDGPTRTGQPAEWRKKPYELSPPGDKYLVWVEGLDHGFGGIVGADYVGRDTYKANEDHVSYTEIVTLAFWDAYLKEDRRALTYLKSDKLAEFSKETVRIEHK